MYTVYTIAIEQANGGLQCVSCTFCPVVSKVEEIFVWPGSMLIPECTIQELHLEDHWHLFQRVLIGYVTSKSANRQLCNMIFSSFFKEETAQVERTIKSSKTAEMYGVWRIANSVFAISEVHSSQRSIVDVRHT